MVNSIDVGLHDDIKLLYIILFFVAQICIQIAKSIFVNIALLEQFLDMPTLIIHVILCF